MWDLIKDILKTGFIITLVCGGLWLIYWAMKKNLKWLFGNKIDYELTSFFVDGIKQGYDDGKLKPIALSKGYKQKIVDSSLKQAYKLVIKEVEKQNAETKKRFGNVEEELEGLEKK